MCFLWQAWHFVTFGPRIRLNKWQYSSTVRPAERQWAPAKKKWHFVTVDVCEEECVCATVVAEKLPCLGGKRPKGVFLDVSEDVVMSFCVAGVALCDIRRV